MKINIVEETPEALPEYEKVSMAFTVKSYFRVEPLENGLGGIKLTEEAVKTPYIKDYDANPEDKPSWWAKRFDLSNWGILSAFIGEQRVGGAAIAWKTAAVDMLDGRTDLTCLWDLRVSPDFRGREIGRKLFAKSLLWARARNCRQLKVETQNINVPACRFYVQQGCQLGAINKYAYPEIMNEIQLVWYRNV